MPWAKALKGWICAGTGTLNFICSACREFSNLYLSLLSWLLFELLNLVEDNESSKCSHRNSDDLGNWPGILMVFLGLFVAGCGSSVFYSLSMSYMDDNTSRKRSPFFFALGFVSRVSGAFLGTVIAGGFLRYKGKIFFAELTLLTYLQFMF